MGLHNTAHYLKNKGRGPDTELVHMSKKEIKGLQELAMAHGGSLTINPDTGLVEAGFLEDILPVVAAAGLTYLTAGAAAPVLTTALGGSTMAGGIAAGALSGAAISGGMAAIQGKDVGNAALMGGLGGALSGGLGAYDGAATADLFTKGAADATTAGAQEAAKGVTAEAVAGGIDPFSGSQTYADIGKAAGTQGVDPFSGAQTYANMGQATPTVTPTVAAPTLNAGDVEAQMGGFYGGQAPANPYANMSNQQIANATGIQTPQTSPTYYSGLKPDQYIQKAGIQALPVASLLEEDPQQVGPEEQKSTLMGLSPNFKPYTAPQPDPYYKARYPTYAAEGGIMQSYANGGMVNPGPVQQMSQNMMGGQSNMYPQSQMVNTNFATPTQMPASAEVIRSDYGAKTDPYTGVMMSSGGLPPKQKYLPKGDAGIFKNDTTATKNLSALEAEEYKRKALFKKYGVPMATMPKTGIKSLGGDFSDTAARGGVAHLGDYSDGGRLLKGPGDGMSDNIPAKIGRKQPARLADGEFVVPADVVSHLGNGSTDAGAKQLYAMMDKIRRARTGKKKQAPAVKAKKFMPA